MDFKIDSITGVPNYSNINKIGFNPIVLMVIVIILAIYYSFFASLGVSSTGNMEKGKGIVIFEVILWGLFLFLLIINGMAYMFNIDIGVGIKNIFTNEPEIDISTYSKKSDDTNDVKPLEQTIVPEITKKKQVFHISDNSYTYPEAKALCKAYGSELANYKEIEDSYNKGGEWCSYGWSDDQMVLYPTQYDKWQRLQKIKGHEQSCGRPGINGGFIDNKNALFGVNCFGYKPEINQTEKEMMDNSSLYPKTKKEINFEKKVNDYKEKIPNILISPFNNTRWSIV